jgi:tRNA(fMet)-specific endonuclease VapC
MLDTNIVSYLMKGLLPTLQTRFDLVATEAIAVSSITEAEVFYGLARKPGAMRLRLAADKFFASVACLAWDSTVARAYGLLRAEQERKGRPLSTEDLMIAAHALTHGLTLVTNDSAFSFVDGLKTEDWTVA